MSDTIFGTGFKQNARACGMGIERRVSVAIECLEDAKRMLDDSHTHDFTRKKYLARVNASLKKLNISDG